MKLSKEEWLKELLKRGFKLSTSKPYRERGSYMEIRRSTVPMFDAVKDELE
jgi:hypothetical protein